MGSVDKTTETQVKFTLPFLFIFLILKITDIYSTFRKDNLCVNFFMKISISLIFQLP